MKLKYSNYPPKLNDEEERYLIEILKDYGLSIGFCVKYNSPEIGECAALAPITLFPSLFPQQCFTTAEAVQKPYNELYAKIASDLKWLESCISRLAILGKIISSQNLILYLRVAIIDDFVKNLWQIHLDLRNGGYNQTLSLGLFRSDYMVHLDKSPRSKPQIKQVEFNTIASSFGGLSSQASKVHKYLRETDIYQSYLNLASATESTFPIEYSTNATTGLAQGMQAAYDAYIKQVSSRENTLKEALYGPNSRFCIIFIVQDGERNIFDQRHLETHLRNQGIRVYRVPFSSILQQTKLRTSDSALLYTLPHAPNKELEVTLVYYRAGYAPTDYTSATDWHARLHIERSRAIRCPTVLTQLAGLKKVQQVLATPGSQHVEHFISGSGVAAVQHVRDTFVPMYPMDNSPAGQEGRNIALDPATAVKFVLKPQREGGGNNIYREDIPGFLKTLPEEQWEAYILMEMIETPTQSNVIHRNGVTKRGNVICELGIYGACLWDQANGGKEIEILYNEEVGHLLRTKGSDSQEGGVAAGFGALDSLYLVDDDAVTG
jgi:glutathione synthase